jgi:REP element-mobilizing transposase RayT
LAKKQKQLDFFKRGTDRYGGSLQTTRKGRQGSRPLSTRHSMHFVLRSTRATGAWSFRRHRQKIHRIIQKFSQKFGVRVHSMANVGNHLHLHLQFTSRLTYKPFIRAITAAIMMAVTGASRWQRPTLAKGSGLVGTRFWDRRPFSRIVQSFRAQLTLRDYIAINRFEGFGYDRSNARGWVDYLNVFESG